MATVATVGSVYATWNFTNTVYPEHEFALTNVVMADHSVSGTKGVLEVNTSGLIVTIDQKNAAHEAECKVTGSIEIKFTPNANAEETVKDEGINLSYCFKAIPKGSSWNHNDGASTPIFSTHTLKHELGLGTPVDSNDDDVADYFTWTISAVSVDECIGFYTSDYTTDGTLVLDTLADYQNFRDNYLAAGNLKIFVSETEPTP